MHADGDLIFKSDGLPFKDEKAATIQATRLLNSEKLKTKVVAVEGGFALKKIHQRRPARVPLSKRNVLTFPDIPGYKLRVFNDDPRHMGQRLRDAEAAGWEYVYDKSELGDRYAGKASKTGSTVNRPVGHGVTGVLMKKKKEWFEEDEKIKQDENDKIEDGLVAAADVDGKYGKVQIGRKKGSFQ